MILGVSLLVAVFSYLAYRRLLCGDADTGAAAAASATFSMWPFLSTIRQTTASPSSPSSSELKRRNQSPKRPVSTTNGSYQVPPQIIESAESPDTTPKALIPTQPSQIPTTIPSISLEPEDGDDPPSFPAIDSAQRASGPSSSLPAPSFHSMPPPPLPNRNFNSRNPNAAARSRSRLAVIGAGASGVAAASGLALPRKNGTASSSSQNKTRSRKVTLEPGHSPLDWARLQKSGIDLRGLGHSRLIKVPPSLLAQHRSPPADVWMALDGKVYNLTAYIPFHPGGEKELMRAAGKDGTKLFTQTHPWVNYEGMLAECMIGILVSEEEAEKTVTALEEVD